MNNHKNYLKRKKEKLFDKKDLEKCTTRLNKKFHKKNQNLLQKLKISQSNKKKKNYLSNRKKKKSNPNYKKLFNSPKPSLNHKQYWTLKLKSVKQKKTQAII